MLMFITQQFWMLKLFDIEQLVSINAFSFSVRRSSYLKLPFSTIKSAVDDHTLSWTKFILKISCFSYKWTQNCAGTQFVCFYFSAAVIVCSRISSSSDCEISKREHKSTRKWVFHSFITPHSRVVCLPSPHCLWARFKAHKSVRDFQWQHAEKVHRAVNLVKIVESQPIINLFSSFS